MYAPHFTALTVLQFYGKPVGQALGAPPFLGAATKAPVAVRSTTPTRLAPMTPRPAAKAPPRARPTAQPAKRTGTSSTISLLKKKPAAP